MNMTPRLKTKYSEEIVPKLKEEFNYANIMMVPKLEKNRSESRYWSCCGR